MTRRFRGTPAAAVLVLTFASLAGCATAPRGAEKEAKPADIDALKDIGGKANALIVFASSRAGGSHLFTMRSDGSETKQLTKGGLTEWNPRFSPDGSRILFSRSVARGTREADAGVDHAWDLFTVKPDGSDATKVAENATWGSWISNDEILFLRGQKIMRMKLGGEDEAKKVMDLSRHSVFDGSTVRGPELSRGGHEIAMSIVGAHRQVGIWSLKKKSWTQVGAGAQATWFPDGKSLAWVNPTGKGLSEIVRTPGEKPAPARKDEGEEADEAQDQKDDEKGEEKAAKGPAKLVDLQGKRSREASPRFSADGKWLVFAAAIGNAEPDLEDYELYLWELGSNDSPTRLTFHSASDRSPDIFVGAGAPQGEAPAAQEDDGEKKEESDKAEKPAESPSEPAETENKEAPASTDAAEPPSEEEAAPAAKAKGRPKAKPVKKRKR